MRYFSSDSEFLRVHAEVTSASRNGFASRAESDRASRWDADRRREAARRALRERLEDEEN